MPTCHALPLCHALAPCHAEVRGISWASDRNMAQIVNFIFWQRTKIDLQEMPRASA